MHGTAPLLRSVASTVIQTPSKIPHIRFHIAVRQSRPGRPRQNGAEYRTQKQRCQSTVAPTAYVERPVEVSEAKKQKAKLQHDDSVAFKRITLEDAPALHKDTTAVLPDGNMFDILEKGNPDRVLSGFMSDTIGTPFIRQAHDHDFNKALLTLDPEYFVQPFKDVDRHYKRPRSSSVLQARSIDDRLASFAAYLDRIVAVRREAGQKLDLQACNHLLKCAASMGDAQFARSVWHSIMPQDGIEPDLESYNHICQALVWSQAFSSAENYNLRVIPRHLELRAARSAPQGLTGHITSNTRTGLKGIREEVLDIFEDCIKKGHTANEMTFVNLMIAMGREADLNGVKSILKSVWNIDVDLLDSYDEEELESPTFYEKAHHLRPSENLLFAVAHIFGSNNEIRTAWLLVDFISRNYDYKVTEKVWLHLVEWAFVLSRRRSSAEREQQRDLGQISHETFLQLIDVMSDEPHNIKPSTVTNYLLNRSWRDKKHLDNTVRHAVELQRVVRLQHRTMKELETAVIKYAKHASEKKLPDAFATTQFYELRRKFTLEFYDFQRNVQLLNIAVTRNILMETDWPGSGKYTEWERRVLPQLVERFTSTLPDTLTYPTKTGTVELVTRYKRRAYNYNEHKLDYRALPRVLNAMDTDDHAKLNRRMAALSEVIVQSKTYCFNCETAGHTHHQCKSKRFASTIPDYKDTNSQEEDKGGIFVLNPTILREAVPFAFEHGAEQEYSKPSLPFE